MADEEDINSIKKDMENLDARIDQMEDLQLTNKLNIIEFKKEFDKFRDMVEKSESEKTPEEVRKMLGELKKEKENLSDWKDKFKAMNDKISKFEKKIGRIDEKSGSKGEETTDETESKDKDNVCDSCGMKNDPDADYCVVCGNEL